MISGNDDDWRLCFELGTNHLGSFLRLENMVRKIGDLSERVSVTVQIKEESFYEKFPDYELTGQNYLDFIELCHKFENATRYEGLLNTNMNKYRRLWVCVCMAHTLHSRRRCWRTRSTAAHCHAHHDRRPMKADYGTRLTHGFIEILVDACPVGVTLR